MTVTASGRRAGDTSSEGHGEEEGMQGGRPHDGDGAWAGEQGTRARRDKSAHGVAIYGTWRGGDARG